MKKINELAADLERLRERQKALGVTARAVADELRKRCRCPKSLLKYHITTWLGDEYLECKRCGKHHQVPKPKPVTCTTCGQEIPQESPSTESTPPSRLYTPTGCK